MRIILENNGFEQLPIVPFEKKDILENLVELKKDFKELVINNKLKEIFLFTIDG